MTSVPLGDVLSRQIPLPWAEAVAVVAELCTVLAQDGGPTAPIPDPMHILLTSGGTVTIRSDGTGTSQQTTPGRLLHALLASSEPPAPLRLFVSVAISSDRYDSIGTFAEALAYYEVSGRAPLIQSAYQRATAAPAVPLPTPAAVPEPKEQVSPVRTDRAKVPTWAFAAGAALLAASAVTLWLYGVVPSPARDTKTAEGDSAVEEAAPAKTTASGSGAAGRPSADAGRGSATGSGGLPTDSDTDPRVRLTDKSILFPATPGSVAPDAGGTQATVAPGEEPSSETIYTSASAGVEPPVAISPLPSTGRNPTLESTGTIELLVDEKGNVEQVRLVSSPSRMQPMMLLSAAKTWMFRPALRDGRPVKYRLRVDVPATLP